MHRAVLSLPLLLGMALVGAFLAPALVTQLNRLTQKVAAVRELSFRPVNLADADYSPRA